MSYQQVFRPDLNLVYTRFGSTVELEDVQQCAVDTFRNAHYQPGMRELVDFRGAVDVDPRLGFESIRDIWETQSTWIKRVRGEAHVVLVGDTDLAFGLIRIYTSLAEQDATRFSPCRDWHAACALLDLDPAEGFLADASKA